MKSNLKAVGAKIKNFFDKEQVTQVARQTKFVRRASDLNGPVFLQSVVLGSIENPKPTLSHWAQVCLDLAVKITPQGIDGRISERSLAFLKEMFGQAMEKFKNDVPLPLPILQQFSAINILDSSVKDLPDNMVDEYPGCGGNGPQASLKVQLVFEFLHGNLKQVVFQAGRDSDQGYRAYLKVVEKESLNLLDLGYFVLDAFKQIMDQDAYFLSRYLHGTALLTPEGERIDLLRTLQAQTGNKVDTNVLLGAQRKHRLPCRLVALRLPQGVADQRRRKAKETAKRKGRTPSKEYLALLDWAIFVTCVPAEMLSTEQVALLYRVRWQIELVFKLWKSYCGLGRIAGFRRERVLTELYAKMIGIVLTHFLIAPLRMPEGDKANREISPVQVRKILGRFARELNRAISCLHIVVNVLLEMIEHIELFGFKQKRCKKPNICHALALVSTILDLNDDDCELEYEFQLR